MLLWFRNDLRVHDNPALYHFLNKTASIPDRKAIFFISEKQWLTHHWSALKIDLIKRHAHQLVNTLRLENIDLDIIYVDDFADQVAYLKNYCINNNVSQVLANHEIEINEVNRDLTCIKNGIPLTLFEADVIVAKGKVLNQSGCMFKVFTPFKKAWLNYVKSSGFEYLGKQIDFMPGADIELTSSTTVSGTWPLVPYVESNILPDFLSHKIASYAIDRDIPSIKGTSGISPYLAAGLISPRFVLANLLNKYPDLLTASDTQEFVWLNELIWREFYRHLLFHYPRLCKNEDFNLKYKNLIWPNNPDLFKAWCDGKTGYPIVDAAMRQLNKTGWMHNRLRMIVASFLTKHLLNDWRLGEKYFMQHLIDGDLAANNGGWQWAASTGCDAQPYFRIFNPIRQSERFDPNGDFIRKYLPELSDIPDKHIHFPHKYLKEQGLKIYWPAIVEHKDARAKALAFFK